MVIVLLKYDEIPGWAQRFFNGEGFPEYVAKGMRGAHLTSRFLLGWIRVHCMNDDCLYEWDSEAVFGLFGDEAKLTDDNARHLIVTKHRTSCGKETTCPICDTLGVGPYERFVLRNGLFGPGVTEL